MQNRTYRSMLLKVLLVGSFGLITSSYAYGLERIRWKVQHTGLPGQLKGIERFAQNIKIMSEGKINFRLYKPGSLAIKTVLPKNWEELISSPSKSVTSPSVTGTSICAGGVQCVVRIEDSDGTLLNSC